VGRPLIEICDLSHERQHAPDSERIFRFGPIFLEIQEGELMVIVGPSGSGKTTLLRLIAGLEQATSGLIALKGRVVSDKHTHILPEHRQVGMVSQEHVLFPHLNVRDNILFGIQHQSITDQEKRLQELEDLVKLHGYDKRFPNQLSWGEQQRVALARALAPEPFIVMLDEPLSHIDVDLKFQVSQELREILKKAGMTTLLVTHDQDVAFDVADRVAVMQNGQIEQIDDPWSLYHMPKTRFTADFIGEAVFVAGRVTADQIQTEVGNFPKPKAEPTDRDVEILLRPEDVNLEQDEQGNGIISGRRFRGSEQLYTVTLPSGQKLLSSQSSMKTWAPGTKVRVQVEPDHIVLFPKR